MSIGNLVMAVKGTLRRRRLEALEGVSGRKRAMIFIALGYRAGKEGSAFDIPTSSVAGLSYFD
jgi:hypothetical protein